jgi:hypothetical protein
MPVVGSATSSSASVRHNATAAERKLAHELNQLSGHFTVKFLGEDDNGDAVFHHRQGQGGPLTAEKFLAAAGYKSPAKQVAGDEFSFQSVKTDADWQNIIDAQEDPATGDKMKALLKGMDVAVATVNDPQPFGARGYLVASDKAGNFYMFRGVVGGMGF